MVTLAGSARLAAFALACSLATTATQDVASPQAALQETPRFRAASHLVQVSVIVRDKQGALLRDLTRDDFTVLDDGKPQKIAFFTTARADGAQAMRAEGAPATAPVAAGANSFGNREATTHPNSVTVVLFDMLNTTTHETIYGKQQVARFLRELRPDDRVAIYAMSSRGLQVVHDFTSDPAPLLRAIERLSAPEDAGLAAMKPEVMQPGFNTEMDQVFANGSQLIVGMALRERMKRTVAALEAIGDHLAGIPGRKNLIWISASFPFSYGFDKVVPSTRELMTAAAVSTLEDSPVKEKGRTAGAPRPNPDPDLVLPVEQGFFGDDLQRAAHALTQANLAVYPVDARGLTAPFTATGTKADPRIDNGAPVIWEERGAAGRKEFDTMNVLAERTGGRAFYNSNDIRGAVRRVVEDSRVTYEIGYYPAHGRWDGRFHNVTVRVNRKDADVLHRRGYFALMDTPLSSAQAAELLSVAVGNPLQASALGVRVNATRAGTNANLQIVLDAHELTLTPGKNERWGGTLSVAILQTDASGKAVATSAQNVDLQLSRTTYEKWMREGFSLNKTIALDAHAEEIRVWVRDVPSGAMGSVFIPAARIR